MSTVTVAGSLLPAGRWVWHKLTRPHVVLGILLALAMLYFVMMPLYIMIRTTVTWQPEDVGLVQCYGGNLCKHIRSGDGSL